MRWLLHDPLGGRADYRFDLNPNVMESPYRTRAVQLHQTVDGAFRGTGAQSPHSWSFGGVLHLQTQYEQLAAWCGLATRVDLTDHLARVWRVRLDQFDATRAGTRKHPWRHRYTVHVTTYEGPT